MIIFLLPVGLNSTDNYYIQYIHMTQRSVWKRNPPDNLYSPRFYNSDLFTNLKLFTTYLVVTILEDLYPVIILGI